MDKSIFFPTKKAKDVSADTMKRFTEATSPTGVAYVKLVELFWGLGKETDA